MLFSRKIYRIDDIDREPTFYYLKINESPWFIVIFFLKDI